MPLSKPVQPMFLLNWRELPNFSGTGEDGSGSNLDDSCDCGPCKVRVVVVFFLLIWLALYVVKNKRVKAKEIQNNDMEIDNVGNYKPPFIVDVEKGIPSSTRSESRIVFI